MWRSLYRKPRFQASSNRKRRGIHLSLGLLAQARLQLPMLELQPRRELQDAGIGRTGYLAVVRVAQGV